MPTPCPAPLSLCHSCRGQAKPLLVIALPINSNAVHRTSKPSPIISMLILRAPLLSRSVAPRCFVMPPPSQCLPKLLHAAASPIRAMPLQPLPLRAAPLPCAPKHCRGYPPHICAAAQHSPALLCHTIAQQIQAMPSLYSISCQTNRPFPLFLHCPIPE